MRTEVSELFSREGGEWVKCFLVKRAGECLCTAKNEIGQ